MKNQWHLILIVLITSSQYSVLGENMNIHDQIEEINRSVLTSNEVNRKDIEKQLLNLLSSAPSSESRGTVYVAIANMYGRDMDNYNKKVVYYAREALKNQIGVVDSCDMYLCLGKAIEVQARQSGTTSNATELENQAKLYIQGLAFVLEHLRTNKRLPIPSVGKYDVDQRDPQYQEIVRNHAKEMADRNDVLQQNRLLTFRDEFSCRVLLIYPKLQIEASAFDHIVHDAVGDTGNGEKVFRHLHALFCMRAEKKVKEDMVVYKLKIFSNKSKLSAEIIGAEIRVLPKQALSKGTIEFSVALSNHSEQTIVFKTETFLDAMHIFLEHGSDSSIFLPENVRFLIHAIILPPRPYTISGWRMITELPDKTTITKELPSSILQCNDPKTLREAKIELPALSTLITDFKIVTLKRKKQIQQEAKVKEEAKVEEIGIIEGKYKLSLSSMLISLLKDDSSDDGFIQFRLEDPIAITVFSEIKSEEKEKDALIEKLKKNK